MKKHIRGMLLLSLFLIGFIPVVWFFNLHFIQTDTFCAINIKEMQSRDDIDMAIIGSSIVRDHFNVDMISEDTGLTAFNIAVPCASMQADIAAIKELYRTHSPEWTVLVLEPYNFDTVREGIEAWFKLAPYLSDPANIIDYYLNVCRDDGYYLDRLFLFRKFGAQTPMDIVKSVGLRYWPEKTYEYLRSTMDESLVYNGGGFLRHDTDQRLGDDLRYTCLREHTGYYYSLFDDSKEYLREFVRIVEENGSKPLFVIYSNHTVHGLAEPGFLDYSESLMRFSRELGVPCYDFTLSKPELLPNLDEYYYDLFHMVGEGADIFSKAYSRIFNAHVRGEDVRHLFYGSYNEYRDSIDFITNAWVTQYIPGEEWNLAWDQDEARVTQLAQSYDVFMADCNRGPKVVPEYKFMLVEEDGSETLLQDFSSETLYTSAKGELDGKVMRIYARCPGQEDDAKHWYDLSIGKAESPLIH